MLPVPLARSPSVGAHGGASPSHSGAGGAAGASGSAGGAAARAPAPRTPEAAAAPGDAGRKRKALYASGIFSPPGKKGKAARKGETRAKFDVKAIRKDVNVQYTWQWRLLDGTYEAFNQEQCIDIETEWRQQVNLAWVWGTRFPVGPNEMLKCLIDFGDMTTSIVGCDWVKAVRRWGPCGAGTGTCPWATAGTIRMMM